MAVLLDGPGRHPGQLLGRSPYMQAVHVDAPARMSGEVVDLKIETAHPNSLAAVLAADERVVA
jgi:tRNA-2-methylthio-N6-dimethylallyladenosine synthase